mmetsp:Transcript_50455/g.118434  ORF Transcript_50455/g.118434 Transcript_50455/m.118434 type:complete len:101 (+) Transcript_50455:1009-1311(+)
MAPWDGWMTCTEHPGTGRKTSGQDEDFQASLLQRRLRRVVVPRKLLTDSLALFHRAIISNDSVCWHVAARKIKRVRARGRMPGRPHAAAQASTEVSRRGR